MRIIVIGLIIAAVILTGGTIMLVRNYLSTQQAEIASQAPKEPSIMVLVAANNLSGGTAITRDNVRWQAWPEDGVEDEFLVKTDKKDPLDDITKEKHLVRRYFSAGEPITMKRLFVSAEPGFLGAGLAAGMRAIAVPIKPETAASGFILPGDRVDVISTIKAEKQAQGEIADPTGLGIGPMKYFSETALENILVLAVDQKTDTFEGGAAIAKTIVLQVTPKEAEILRNHQALGSLSLVLRSLDNSKDAEDAMRRKFTTDMESSPLYRAQLKQDGTDPDETATNKTSPQQQAPRRGITIYRPGTN